ARCVLRVARSLGTFLGTPRGAGPAGFSILGAPSRQRRPVGPRLADVQAGEERDVTTAPDAPPTESVPALDVTESANERLQRWIARTSRPLDLLALVFLVAIFVQWL